MTDRRPGPRLVPLYLLAAAVPISISVASIAAGLAIVGAAYVAVRERGRVAWPPRAVGLALAALVATYLVATAAAPAGHHDWYTFGEELWIKLLLVAVPVLLGPHATRAARVLDVLLVASAVAGAYGVSQHFHGWDVVRGESLMSEWGHHGARAFLNHRLSWGGHLLIVILLLAARLVVPAWRRSGFAFAALLVLQVLALFWSYARGALLGVVAGLAALTVLLRGRRRLVGVVVLVAPLLLAVALPDVRLHLKRLSWTQRHETRLNLLESSWRGIQARPLTGWGPGNFALMMDEHEVEGYYENRAHSHNDLVMHAVNAGFAGAVAAAALLVAVCVVLWRARHGPGPAAWIVAGALAVQVGITLAGLFQVYQTDDEVELLLYLVLGLALAAARDCQGAADVRKSADPRPAPTGGADPLEREDER